MELVQGILNAYSTYTGLGILNVLFFVGLVYVALVDSNRTNRTILLYGSAILVLIIFCPLTFYLYDKFVDVGTYWRLWWMVPAGIGLAYVGTKVVDNHRITGFCLALFILFLGGNLVYTADLEYRIADNVYQIPDEAIDIADFLEEYEEDTVRVALPTELLTYVRQYDPYIALPYGREQYGGPWGTTSGFYIEMNLEQLDFEKIAEKCVYNNTKYIVVSRSKGHVNEPIDSGFIYLTSYGEYDIYEARF